MEAALSSVDGRLQRWLRRSGIEDAATLVNLFSDDEWNDGTVLEYIKKEAMDNEDEDQGSDVAEQLLSELRGLTRKEQRVPTWGKAAFASLPSWEVSKQVPLRKRARDREAEETQGKRANPQGEDSHPPALVLGRRLVVTRRQALLDGDPRGRERAEEQERDRWTSELADLLQGAGVDEMNCWMN